MTKVISISTDRNIFDENSAVRKRQMKYGTLFEELHIVVFTKLSASLPARIEIAPNIWVYGTNSICKIFHISRAVKIVSRIVSIGPCAGSCSGAVAGSGRGNFLPENTVVSVQDPFETGIVGLKLKKKFNFPLHLQIHTDFMSSYFRNHSLFNRLRARIAKKVLINADAIRVVSKRISNSLSVLGLKSELTPVILPIFVDIEKIKNTKIAPGFDLKKKYPQFNFIILMASRLTREKNIGVGVEILRRLHDVYSKIGLVIVGNGPENKKLKRLAKKLNVEKSIVFEPWQNDLISYYKSANVFILTSDYEGYGMTLVEAIASHCPTVSTDTGIASELLKDGISFVCPVGDIDCLFKTISSLVENLALREGSVHTALERLNGITVTNEEYLALYKKSVEQALSKNVKI